MLLGVGEFGGGLRGGGKLCVEIVRALGRIVAVLGKSGDLLVRGVQFRGELRRVGVLGLNVLRMGVGGVALLGDCLGGRWARVARRA